MIEEVPIVDGPTEVVAELAAPEVSEPPKRGRGRPPGAKGKAKPAKPPPPPEPEPEPEPPAPVPKKKEGGPKETTGPVFRFRAGGA